MSTATENFYDAIEGALTSEQAAQALASAESGDTGSKPDAGGAPTTTPDTDTKDAKQTPEGGESKDDGATLDEDKLNGDNAVILAKDGKHTISFDKLEKARQDAQHWKAQAEAAQQQMAELQAQAQARAEAGQAPTKTDNMVAQAEAAMDAGADPALFGDFSEEALAAGIQKLVAQQVQEQVSKEVSKALAPMQAKQAEDAQGAHLAAIYKAHPNADSIAQSSEFAAWVDSHPSAVRAAYWGLFDEKTGGTAAEIVEVFDAFTKANEKFSATPAAKTAATVVAPKPEAPMSLTSIPGGQTGHSTADAMADMTGPELYQALENKTPEQIEAFLNKQL